MLKKLNWLAVFCLAFTTLSIAQNNMFLLDSVGLRSRLNDVWETPCGAMVGLYDGIAIVPVNQGYGFDKTNIEYIDGPQTIWRDLKSYNSGYTVYVSNEEDSGILIIRFSPVDCKILSQKYWKGGQGVNFTSAHNLYVDEALGYLYIFGSDHGNGGAIIADIKSDPSNPIIETVYDLEYVHDGYVRDDTMWLGEINKGQLSIVDVSDKTSPTIPQSAVINTQITPHNFCHNVWLSDDKNYLITSDEKPGAFLTLYDVSDLLNIKELDRIQIKPGQNIIPHNAIFQNNKIYVSYYTEGTVIIDYTDPENMVIVGSFDSNPDEGTSFNGVWGVYPSDNGYILASDGYNGLHMLLDATILPGSISGIVTDLSTTNPIPSVRVSFLDNINMPTTCGLAGNYLVGAAEEGYYDLKFSKKGYQSQIIKDIQVESAVNTIKHAALKPLTSGLFRVIARDKTTQNLLSGVQLRIENENEVLTATTNASGVASFNNFYGTEYNFHASKWGYLAEEYYDTTLNTGIDTLLIEFTNGYQDGFTTDLGWTATLSPGGEGKWERSHILKGIGSVTSPASPHKDCYQDMGNFAMLTGSGGDYMGNNDVDDGVTTLTSPTFDLSSYSNPVVCFKVWFFTINGSTPANDTLHIEISNGSQTVKLAEHYYDWTKPSEWTTQVFELNGLIPLTSTMNVKFIVSDSGAKQHVVEAGLDLFRIYDGKPAPIANFHVESIGDGCGQRRTLIKDASLHFPTTFTWSLPDVAFYQGGVENITTTHDMVGSHNIGLTVSDGSQSDTKTLIDTVHVFDKPKIDSVFVFATQPDHLIKAEVSPFATTHKYRWYSNLVEESETVKSNISQDHYEFVQVTNEHRCWDTARIKVDWTVGFEEPKNLPQFSISPNPANQLLRIQNLDLVKDAELILYDNTGRLLTRHRLIAENHFEISTQELPNGIYLVSIINSNGIIYHQEKCIVQH